MCCLRLCRNNAKCRLSWRMVREWLMGGYQCGSVGAWRPPGSPSSLTRLAACLEPELIHPTPKLQAATNPPHQPPHPYPSRLPPSCRLPSQTYTQHYGLVSGTVQPGAAPERGLWPRRTAGAYGSHPAALAQICSASGRCCVFTSTTSLRSSPSY